VILWRCGRLEQAGFDRGLAKQLADDRRTDIDALLEIDRGCPPALATRILAPLEAKRRNRGDR
jgi:hypothetical protein